MKKFLSSAILTSLLACPVLAQSFTGSLYIEDATVVTGRSAVLSVQITNNLPIASFQFDMDVPEGLTFTSYKFSDERLPDGATNDNTMGFLDYNATTHHVKIAATLNYPEPLKGNEGEVVQIYFNAAEDMPLGQYQITLTDIDIADYQGRDYDIPSSTFTLTVEELTFDEGYSVQIAPFQLTAEDEGTEVAFTLENATPITNVVFDVYMPTTTVEDELTYIDAVLGKNKYTTSDDVNADGSIRVTIDKRGSNKIAAGADTEIATLGLVYDADILPEGIHTLTIKNIQLTDTDGNIYNAAPYTTEIYVGASPKAAPHNGAVAYHGNYADGGNYQLLVNSLPEGCTVDLTEVSAMAGDPKELLNDNLILTQDEYIYGRKLSGNIWGTLCLPFDASTNGDVQLYTVDSASKEYLKVEKSATIPANTPAVFKAENGSFVLTASNNGSIQAEAVAATTGLQSTSADADWTVKGSFAAETVNTTAKQAYILTGDELRKVTSTIHVKAFRAWFDYSGSGLNARLRLVDNDETGIQELTPDQDTVIIYDLQGRQQQQTQENLINIVNGQKTINK